jgi:hypothetical protein
MQNTKSLLIATLSSAILIAAVPFTGSAVGSGSSEKVLYSFSGGSDGANPAGALVADKAGNLYAQLPRVAVPIALRAAALFSS